MKFTELSQGAFIFVNFHIILTFLGLYSMQLNAVLRPQNVCKRVVCLQTAPCRGTHRILQHTLRKKQPSAFLFQTRESILTLRDKKQGTCMARL